MSLESKIRSIEVAYTIPGYLGLKLVLLIVLFAGTGSVAYSQHLHTTASKELKPVTEADFYKITTVPIPAGVSLEVGGLAQMPDGRLAVSTRMGELWIIESAAAGRLSQPYFKLFASGLHEPLGLAYKDNAFFVAQRSELTRISDVNGDDKADNFETISTWPLTGNYCEYNHGPIIAPDGSFYINFNLGDNGVINREPFYGEMGSHTNWRGWMMKVTPKGELTPFAAGLRSPAGIGINKKGELFYTENQGGWVGTGYISHVESGDFFGHPSSLKSAGLPGSTVKLDTSDIPRNDPMFHEAVKLIPGLKMPSVRIPHGILGTSLAGFVEDNTSGGFGPFQGQFFVGDEGQASIMRVFMEKVNGAYQGAVFPFRKGFLSGILRMEWSNDNSVFVGMSDRGWNSTGPERYGLQQLSWTGKTPFEIKSIKAMPDGFELEFTSPVSLETGKNVQNYKMSGFDYGYHMEYGSKVYDKKDCVIRRVVLSEDGLKARLLVEGLREGYIHEFKCEGLRSSEGYPLLHDFAYYTLNSIPTGNKMSVSGSAGSKSSEWKAPAVEKEIRNQANDNMSAQPKNLTKMPDSWKNGPDKTITIGTKPGLKFDTDNLNFEPGDRVKLVFTNTDDMQHNLVIVLPNSANEVGEAALKLGVDGANMNYVPNSDKVLYYTRLLGPGSQETIYFTAPEKEGKFPFVCTYPGHYLVMRGIMTVQKAK